jgi:hypothetical protein
MFEALGSIPSTKTKSFFLGVPSSRPREKFIVKLLKVKFQNLSSAFITFTF